MGSTPAGREDARIEEVDGRRGSNSQPAEPPLPKRPPPRALQANQKLARQPPTAREGQGSYFRKPPRFWGVPEDFFWKREPPFLPDCCLRGEEGRCDVDGREDCLAGPLWPEELEYG